MKLIVSVTFTSSKNNFEVVTQFQGKDVTIRQVGADFDPKKMEALLREYDGHCDALAISGYHPPVKVGRKIYHHAQSQTFLSLPKVTPVLSGQIFRQVYIPWAVRKLAKESCIIKDQRIGFLSGLVQQTLAESLSEYTSNLYFADPYFHMGVPKALYGIDSLRAYAKRIVPFLQKKNLASSREFRNLDRMISTPSFKEWKKAPLFVTSASLIERIEPSFFRDKTVLLDSLSPMATSFLDSAGVAQVVHFLPDIGLNKDLPPFNFAIFEALLQVFRASDHQVGEEDVLDLITEQIKTPQVQVLRKETVLSPIRKFAFIVHPLSIRDLFRHPLLRRIEPALRPGKNFFEKAISHMPSIKYGVITGIQSQVNGQRAEGIVYSIFDTPKQLLQSDPQRVYEKLIKVCEHAAKEGASLIGLGAFTKVVGDAGVTVANRSPIPVTTGNSLSAAATLWAARVASDKLGFSPLFERDKRIEGYAMVVGATGSIGAVSAKLLSRVATNLVLTAPRPDKLLELREEISRMSPDTKIHVATDANRFADKCDLIVVSTSAIEGGVLNLQQVKSGAIICDVSRPLSFTKEEVVTRPDILVIESGEVDLPGHVEITCDIGLEDSTVYACLAETALLTLEGRYESFTLSRFINYQRVNEIYDLAKKHGARLATIRGPVGIITDQEIALCREHILKKRKE